MAQVDANPCKNVLSVQYNPVQAINCRYWPPAAVVFDVLSPVLATTDSCKQIITTTTTTPV